MELCALDRIHKHAAKLRFYEWSNGDAAAFSETEVQ